MTIPAVGTSAAVLCVETDHAERDGLDGHYHYRRKLMTYRLMAESGDRRRVPQVGQYCSRITADYAVARSKESTEHTLKRIICFPRYAAAILAVYRHKIG